MIVEIGDRPHSVLLFKNLFNPLTGISRWAAGALTWSLWETQMVSRNIKIKHLFDGEYEIKLIAPELDKIYCKYDGLVHIEIKKPQDDGTEQQNRAAHALMNELFIFMMQHTNNPIMDFVAFKEYLKLQFGFAYYFDNKEKGNMAVPKRWSQMTKEERSSFIDKLISYIHEVGADTEKKVQEILQGMADNALLTGGHA